MSMLILAINPGSTSTKIAIYRDQECESEETFAYSAELLRSFPTIISQKEYRLQQIEDHLKAKGLSPKDFDAIVGRGGAIGPIKSGAYLVNQRLAKRLAFRPVGQHASNLGGVLAYELAQKGDIPAYVYDGVTVDELDDVARITGLEGVRRFSRCHALNMRAVAMQTAEEMGKAYEDSNFVVAHLGGGITMSAHKKGRMADVLIDSEGPLSPERAGRLPATILLKYMKAKNLSPQNVLEETRGRGGLVSLIGTNNVLEAQDRADQGDAEAEMALRAMCYQAAKGIGELSTVLCGDVDRIILTGAIAKSKRIVEQISERVSFIAPVVVIPGESELKALALGALRVLQGKEEAHEYDERTDSIDRDMI